MTLSPPPASEGPRWPTVTVAIILLGVLLFSERALSQEPAGLTAQQRRQLQQVLAEFRRARSHEQRLAILARAELVGPPAVEALTTIISAELKPQLDDYRQSFFKAASTLAAARTQPDQAAEISELRTKALGVSQSPDFTKEQIEEVADPALAQLRKLLGVDSAEVLRPAGGKPNAALLARRANVVALGRQRQFCQEALWKLRAQEKARTKDEDKTQQNQLGMKPVAFDEYLAQEEQMAAALAMPMDEATRQIFADNSQLADQLEAEEARCMLALNLTRCLLGLNPLKIDLKLVAAARDHSQDMVKHNFFAHQSPLEGKKEFWERAPLFDTTASAENIASGISDGAALHHLWWHSPGHHRNMLRESSRIGVGRYEQHWTQLFGRM